MKTLKFQIDIDASREKVWDSIVNDAKYRKWCSAFYEGSYFEGGWNQGDSIHFIAESDKGEKEGMVAEIAGSKYPECISIRHLGQLVKGKVDTTSDDVKKWAPSHENYTLQALGKDKTRFLVEVESVDSYADMFNDMWPRALKLLKEVSERG